MSGKVVFLDANVIIYAIDKTSVYHKATVSSIQQLLNNGDTLCSSHHVIEEVVYIAKKLGETNTTKVIQEIAKLPDLILVEPNATMDFATRYCKLRDKHNLGVNDSLLLQLMLDGGIKWLFSYDKKFISSAKILGIKNLPGVYTK